MGTVCSATARNRNQSAHPPPKGNDLDIERLARRSNSPPPRLREQSPEEQEIREKRQTKIDLVLDSLDLSKKRFSVKDSSVLQRQIEQELQSRTSIDHILESQGQRLERITIEVKDLSNQPSIREKILSQLQRDIQVTKVDESQEENTHCNTVYSNVRCKQLRNINQNSISLLNKNTIGDSPMKSVLYKMVADIMFQIERKKLFEEIILRSQESFLQNLQISDKHINGYGVLRVLKEALKKFNIDLVLQNDFACQQGTLLHYSKLQIQLEDLPRLLSFQNHRIFLLQFGQGEIKYSQLRQNSSMLQNFLELLKDCTRPLAALLQQESRANLLFICQQQSKIVAGLQLELRDGEQQSIAQQMIQQYFKGTMGFEQCLQWPATQYVGVELSDIDPWISREFKEETNCDSQSITMGWKLFGLRSVLKEGKSKIGYVDFCDSSYRKVYTISEIMKCHAQAINKIEVKVYGQKRIYKVMYQVSYPDEERLTSVRHGISYLKSFEDATLIGILLYDDDKGTYRDIC